MRQFWICNLVMLGLVAAVASVAMSATPLHLGWSPSATPQAACQAPVASTACVKAAAIRAGTAVAEARRCGVPHTRIEALRRLSATTLAAMAPTDAGRTAAAMAFEEAERDVLRETTLRLANTMCNGVSSRLLQLEIDFGPHPSAL